MIYMILKGRAKITGLAMDLPDFCRINIGVEGKRLNNWLTGKTSCRQGFSLETQEIAATI
ncbi:hypothetical protein HYG86_13180 [Alkalicella caledoniensis]|uniref:Uncharacterized protein n=1 Tax=Alkalicella caledoniensis TaxID=2731377 RepID=A0A7G9WAE8_ALKCA|nr:hypothetical protein [Alkalicella caledoniensis]QNO15660.1 hypothetical protein HYG86_13180 [Alkalicella caledoniensis]